MFKIKSGIVVAKESFSKKTLLFSKVNLDLKKREVKCYIWSVILFGCKTWMLSKRENVTIQAMEMWVWRKIEKI